jgi:threonine synthase
MPKNRFVELRCLSCKRAYPIETYSTCSSCGGILSAVYDLRQKFVRNPRSKGIWGYKEFFPPVGDEDIVSLGEGGTALVQTRRFSDGLGRSSGIYCKLEGGNPSGSFKDRIASLGLSIAKGQGKKGVFTASSGNAAAAVAAYAAHAGLKSLILVRDDSTYSKLVQIGMYGPRMLRVRNLFDTKEKLARGLELTQKALPEWMNHFAWAVYNPLLTDAVKTIAYEIVLQDDLTPDWVFVPTAGGDLLYGIYKGFRELEELGLVNKIPRIVAVQGKGADPLVQSFMRRDKHVEDIAPPATTVAGALRVTFGADHALIAIRESSGLGISVSDSEILNTQRKIASSEGIFCEVSSAAALAAVARAHRERKVDSSESVVAVLTGSGFKDYGIPEEDSIPLADSVESIPRILRSLAKKS